MVSKSNVEEIIGILWLIAAYTVYERCLPIAIGCSIMAGVSIFAAVYYAIKDRGHG